ncbi:MAG: hypothetical protein E7422_03535 [Ruminococcaceae bacterium]|nr:hypothetical protein [Oscillospiraceae bacterium]MBE7008204.1 hypothetical protein [Oscillospiraceae bacterium]
MKKRFYIKKNPSAQGNDIEWIELSKQAFTAFLASPESKGRYFVNMGNAILEASEEAYLDWLKEKNHRDYLRKQANGITVLSISENEDAERESGESAIKDASVDMEADVLRKIDLEALRSSLASLDDESYYIIHSLFFAENPLSTREMENKLGVSHTVIVRRKNKILKKMKLGVSKSEKSQQ